MDGRFIIPNEDDTSFKLSLKSSLSSLYDSSTSSFSENGLYFFDYQSFNGNGFLDLRSFESYEESSLIETLNEILPD